MVVALYLSHHGAVLLGNFCGIPGYTVTIGYAAELVMKIS